MKMLCCNEIDTRRQLGYIDPVWVSDMKAIAVMIITNRFIYLYFY